MTCAVDILSVSSTQLEKGDYNTQSKLDKKPLPNNSLIHSFLFSFLQVLLPCDQQYLRAQASQRATYTVSPKEFLPYDVERNLTKLFQKELTLCG